jgi:uncharacterized protein
MYKKQNVILILSFCILTSCAYNKQFLKPSKYNDKTKFIIANKTKTDSLVVNYNGTPYQPIFLKNGKDTMEQNYTIESVIFKNDKGINLNGWMIKSKNVGIIKNTVLHFHGNTGSLLGQYSAIKPLVDKNMQVFVFDYSGFGFSEGQATRANLLTDGIAALNYLKTRPDVKNTKMVLYGQSYGGHLAVCVASKAQNNFDLLVAEGAFSNHKDLSALGANPFIAFMSRIFVKEIYSGTKLINRVNKPVLIIHSTEDKVIPFKMGEKLFQNSNEPKQFLKVKGQHLDATKNNLDEVATTINKMLSN